MANSPTTKAKAEAAKAAAPASIPPRPRKILPKGFHEASYRQTTWIAVPAAEDTFDDVLKPEYWSNITGQIKPDDIILVKPEMRDYFAELIVEDATGVSVTVSVLRKIERADNSTDANAKAGFDVRWVAPTVKFCVFRLSDGARVSEGHGTKQAAWLWVSENESVATVAGVAA